MSGTVAGWLLLVGAGLGLVWTIQAVRPIRFPSVLAIPSFFMGWLANELALHHLLWQLLATAVLLRLDALGSWPGRVGLALAAVQWVVALTLVRFALDTPRVMEEALVDALGADYRDDLPDDPAGWDEPRLLPIVLPSLVRHKDVRRVRDITYSRVRGTTLRLDLFMPRGAPAGPRPVVVYVHGGAWVLGFRDRQGLPILVEMARRGWVGVQISYGLSPRARFPEHLHDVKRAIAWIREHADEYDLDPDMVTVVGGSAGGHLAALAALTGGRADLQPGFEDADTSVQACVPFYGVYDAVGELGVQDDDWRNFIGGTVIQADLDEAPDMWRLFSPQTLIRPDAPPFLVVHGLRDTLTSPQEAQTFAANLAAVSSEPVGFAGLPATQHAFDVFPSIRTSHVVLGMARFLAVVRTRAARRQVAGDLDKGRGGA